MFASNKIIHLILGNHELQWVDSQWLLSLQRSLFRQVLASRWQVEDTLVWESAEALEVVPFLEDVRVSSTTSGDDVDWNTQ